MAGSSTFFDGYYNPDTSENPKISGVQVGFGFKYKAQAPLDGRLVVRSYAELQQLVTERGAYPGMIVYVTNYDPESTEEPKGQLYYFDGYVDNNSVLHGDWIVFSQMSGGGGTTEGDVITSKVLLTSENGSKYILAVENDGSLATEDYDGQSDVVTDTILLESPDGSLFTLGVADDGSLISVDYENEPLPEDVTTNSVVIVSDNGKKFILTVQDDGSLTTSDYDGSLGLTEVSSLTLVSSGGVSYTLGVTDDGSLMTTLVSN